MHQIGSILAQQKKKNKSVDITPRELAFEFLMRIEGGGAFADRILATADERLRETRDRAFLREIVLGVLRNKLRLDHIIGTFYDKGFSKLDPAMVVILRIGLYQLIWMNSVPDWAAVNECVKLAEHRAGRGASGLVNAILRRFGRDGEPSLPDDPAESLSVELSHPLWLVKRWIEAFGYDNARAMCVAGNEKHSVYVRTASHRIDADTLQFRLSEEAYDVEPVVEMPGYFSISKAAGLFDNDLFRDGFATVQDPSAGVAATLLTPVEGDDILDLCSAPGGKTTQLAELMNDKGSITAIDLHAKRLGLVKTAAARLGLESVHCIEADAKTYVGEENKQFQKVLLDAPCSGTGVLSKRLDMRWRVEFEDVQRLAGVQAELLDHAAELTASGGTLVYSTCTMEREENEDIVESFLKQHDDFALEKDDRFAAYEIDFGYRMMPHLLGGAGAYAAKMRKKDG